MLLPWAWGRAVWCDVVPPLSLLLLLACRGYCSLARFARCDAVGRPGLFGLLE